MAGRRLRTLFRRANRQDGQAVVELALVLPVLVLMVLGMVQVGAVLSAYLNLEIATSEGARLAITGASDSAIVARVDKVATTLNTQLLQVAVSPAAPRTSGTDVTVTADYSEPILFGELASLWGADIALQAKVTMSME